MARVLTHNVLVRDEHGNRQLLPAGSEVPEWAHAHVGEHVLSDEEPGSEPGSRSQAASAAADAAKDAASAAASAASVVASGVPDGPPPQSGAGSGRAAWSRYAISRGVTFGADDSRDEIVEACEKAGVTTRQQ